MIPPSWPPLRLLTRTTGRCHCRCRCRRLHSRRGRSHCHRAIPGNFRRPLLAAAGRAHHAAAGAVSVTPGTYLLTRGAVAVGHARSPSPLWCTPLPLLLTMSDTRLTRSPRSVAEVLGTGSIPAELAAILAEHSRTVCKDGLARTPEERTGRGCTPSSRILRWGMCRFPAWIRSLS